MRAKAVLGTALFVVAIATAGCCSTLCPCPRPNAPPIPRLPCQITEGVWTVSRTTPGGQALIVAYASVIAGPEVDEFTEWWLVRDGQSFPLDKAAYTFAADMTQPIGVPPAQFCPTYRPRLMTDGGNPPKLYRHLVIHIDEQCP